MNKCVILQPSYIPWRGVFHQIQKSDTFVFYDDVQYDKHGWRNRNRVKTPKGPQWLTIPVHSKGNVLEHTPINKIQIDWNAPWPRKHWETIRQLYAKAPFFKKYAPLIESFYQKKTELLCDFTIETTVALALELGIRNTRFVRSSELHAEGAKTDRLLAMLKILKVDHYISGPSAREYLECEKLNSAGIAVEWMVYDYPSYDQLYPPYEPGVTILDLLFMKGPQAGEFIWGKPVE